MSCPHRTLLVALALAGACPGRAEALLRVANDPASGIRWHLTPRTLPAAVKVRGALPGKVLEDLPPCDPKTIFQLGPGGMVEFRAASNDLALTVFCKKWKVRFDLTPDPDERMQRTFRKVGHWDPLTRTLTLGKGGLAQEPRKPSPAPLSPVAVPLHSPIILPELPLPASVPSWSPGAGGAAALPAPCPAPLPVAPTLPAAAAKPAEPLLAPGMGPSGGKRKRDAGEDPAPGTKRLRTDRAAAPGPMAVPGAMASDKENRRPDAPVPAPWATQVICNQDPSRTWSVRVESPDRTVVAQRTPSGKAALGSPGQSAGKPVVAGEVGDYPLEPGATLWLRVRQEPKAATITLAVTCAAMESFEQQSLAYHWTLGAGGARLEPARDWILRVDNPWEDFCSMEGGALVLSDPGAGAAIPDQGPGGSDTGDADVLYPSGASDGSGPDRRSDPGEAMPTWF